MRRQCSITLTACALSAGALLSAPVAGAAGSTSISLDATQQHQTIDGFGTCLSQGVSYYTSPDFVNMYARDLGASMVRVPLTSDVLPKTTPVTFGSDIDADVSLLNFNNYDANNYGSFTSLANAAKLDQMKLVGSIWTPPHWMKTNYQNSPVIDVYNQVDWGNPNDPNNPDKNKPYHWWYISANSYQPVFMQYDPANPDSAGGHLSMDPTNLTQFGRYVASYVVGYRQKFGVNLSALSLQNEPVFYEPYVSCVYTPDEYVAAVKAIGHAFDDYNTAHPGNPITTKLIAPEDVGVDGGGITDRVMSYINAINADPDARKYVPIIATHGYEGANGPYGNGRANLADFQNRLASNPKPLYQMEQGGSVNQWNYIDPSTGVQDGAITVALRIHDGLVYGDDSAWFYWQTADGGPTVSTATLTEGTDTTSKKYNVAKQFFRFIRPGSVRIDASPDNLTGVNVSAYEDPATGALTVVMVNMGGDTSTTINLPAGFSAADLGMWRTSETENTAYLGTVSPSGNQVSLFVPALSVVTLSNEPGLPVPEPSSLLLMVGLAGPAVLMRRRRGGRGN
jgi:O-glycosyl hydrolase